MRKHEIMDHLMELQIKVSKMGFKGQNEYDLFLREEIADWLLRQFAVIKTVCDECNGGGVWKENEVDKEQICPKCKGKQTIL